MAHYLINEHGDTINTLQVFDRKLILHSIVEYLTKNKGGMLTHEKDFSKEAAKKYAGYETLNVYECNPKTGRPSLVLTRGNKEYYKALLND